MPDQAALWHISEDLGPIIPGPRVALALRLIHERERPVVTWPSRVARRFTSFVMAEPLLFALVTLSFLVPPFHDGWHTVPATIVFMTVLVSLYCETIGSHRVAVELSRGELREELSRLRHQVVRWNCEAGDYERHYWPQLVAKDFKTGFLNIHDVPHRRVQEMVESGFRLRWRLAELEVELCAAEAKAVAKERRLQLVD